MNESNNPEDSEDLSKRTNMTNNPPDSEGIFELGGKSNNPEGLEGIFGPGSKINNPEDLQEEYERLFPSRWERITQCRRDANLQSMYSLEDAKHKHLEDCSACPMCGRSADQVSWAHYFAWLISRFTSRLKKPRSFYQLSWVYYLDPEHHYPRQGGWMTVCDTDQKEVDFFVERQEYYPWEIVDAARNDQTLQAQFNPQSKIPLGHMHCPKCNRPPEQLAWF